VPITFSSERRDLNPRPPEPYLFSVRTCYHLPLISDRFRHFVLMLPGSDLNRTTHWLAEWPAPPQLCRILSPSFHSSHWVAFKIGCSKFGLHRLSNGHRHTKNGTAGKKSCVSGHAVHIYRECCLPISRAWSRSTCSSRLMLINDDEDELRNSPNSIPS
jgi:hypothetical protein